MIVVDPNNPRGIVWIASYPKSGNTWVRIFLYHMVRILGGHPRAENDLHALDNVSGYEARFYGLFEQIIGKPLTSATREEVSAARMKVHAYVAEHAPSIAIVKTHNLLGQVLGHPTINMNASAGAIYLVRDPRDVVISLADHLGAPIDDAIEVMNKSFYASQNGPETAFEAWGNWSENVMGWTMAPSEGLLILRYEDLLDDPMKHFATVAKHLGQELDDDQLREAVELSSFRELYDQETQGDFRERSPNAERFFRVGKAGQWAEQLTPAQVERITDAHHEQMRKHGYLN